MPPRTPSDELQPLLDQLQAWCGAEGVTLVRGWFQDDPAVPELILAGEGGHELEPFLSAIKQLNVRLVAVSANRLAESDVEARLEELDESDDERRDEVEECRSRIGQIGKLLVSGLASTPRAVLHAEFFADWWEAVHGELDFDEESDDDEEDEEAWEARRDEFAREVAKLPAFLESTNKQQRMYVVRQQIKKSPDANLLSASEVVSAAEAIAQVEVFPELEAKATKLAESGRSESEIAAALGVTSKLVKRLLR